MAQKKFIYDEFGIISADFFNIDLANDNRHFLNPYNIGLINHPVAIESTRVAVHFFESVRQELLAGNVERAESLFCRYLTEPRETCLGYATNGVYGKGINELAQYIINQIYYEDNHLINEIKRIEDIKLYIDNVADDRVSDIYTNVIRGVLLRYTEEQCDLHGIPLVLQKSKAYWNPSTASWEYTVCRHFVWHKDNNVKLLVPKCFIGGVSYTLSKLINKVILSDLTELEVRDTNSSIRKLHKDNTPYVTKKDMRLKLRQNQIALDKAYARKYSKENFGCSLRLRESIEDKIFNNSSCFK